MARPRSLTGEVQAVQVHEPQLRIHRTAQPSAHPRRYLAPAPQTAVRGHPLQHRFQRRQAGRVEHRLLPAIAPPPVAETGKALAVPAVDQLLDPATAEPGDPRHLRRWRPAPQQPDHLQMRAPNRVPLAAIRRLDLPTPTAPLNRQQPTHANPPYLVVGTDRITKPTNQSTGIGITQITSSDILEVSAWRACHTPTAPCPCVQMLLIARSEQCDGPARRK